MLKSQKSIFLEQTYQLGEGDCVFIDCRKAYSHSTSDNLWSLQWCHFYAPSLPAVYEKYKERGGLPVFHPADIEPFTTLLTDIYDLASSSDYIRDMRINEKLGSLLTLLMEQSWHPESIAGMDVLVDDYGGDIPLWEKIMDRQGSVCCAWEKTAFEEDMKVGMRLMLEALDV